MKESQAVTTLLSKLRIHGHFWKATDRFRAGIPDIVGCYAGRFIGIEMKIDYNTPSAIQLYTLNDIIKNLGYGAIIKYRNVQKLWYLGIDGDGYKMIDFLPHLLDRMKHHEKDI